MKKQIFTLMLGVILLFALIRIPSTKASSTQTDFVDNNPLYLPVIFYPAPSIPPGTPGYCLTSEEMKLANLINDYRATKGLQPVSLSASLSMVGQYHVRDLQDNNPNSGTDDRGLDCNGHSWSDMGYWSPVCYTSDHKYASGMWLKPQEITKGLYTEYGYEIAIGADGWQASAAEAFNGWKNSPAHNAVIVEEGPWVGANWPLMGIGIYRGYAVVWFGKGQDVFEPIKQCE